jgi:hypothetical protein
LGGDGVHGLGEGVEDDDLADALADDVALVVEELQDLVTEVDGGLLLQLRGGLLGGIAWGRFATQHLLSPTLHYNRDMGKAWHKGKVIDSFAHSTVVCSNRSYILYRIRNA